MSTPHPSPLLEEGTMFTRSLVRLRTAWGRFVAEDRGDVPGWVLITLMTAGLVVVIWALAGPALADLFTQAIDRVSGL